MTIYDAGFLPFIFVLGPWIALALAGVVLLISIGVVISRYRRKKKLDNK
ncbi:MAG: LPXTG cell wall anchor domain-containing protein [Bacilli bacterium]|nr:LPXTG cell wall anchor domain-containing protein [Bacilli bacterium]